MKKPMLLMAVGVISLSATSHANLVAHYKFDEAAGAGTAVNSVSPGTDDGTVGSAVITGVDGISGSAYSFGGATSNQADIVDMGNAEFLFNLLGTRKLTFSAWVKTTDTTGNRNTVVFAGDDTTSSVYTDMGVSAQTGFVGAATARNRPVSASAAQQTGIYSTPGAAPVNDGLWHHLAMTVDLDSGLLTIYVDGVYANAQAMTVKTFPTFNNFEIGRLGRSSPVDPFSGLVDDVQVYDQALLPYQIAYLKAHPGQPYVAVDTDGDGLDDAWEIAYFGSITAQDGTGDPDGDGITNADEFAAGSAPGVLPTVTGSTFSEAGDFVIHFTGNPGTTYRVVSSADVSSFQTMEPPVTVTMDSSGIGTVTVPAGQVPVGRAFFRLEVP